MNIRILLCIAAATTSLTIGLRAPASAATSGQSWIANGATACAKYLTPDVLAGILEKPVGSATKIDGTSCNTGPIYITLMVKDVDVFKLELPRIIGVHMMSGVGDLAYWNQAGAISAVKGHDRGCDIGMIGGAPKIHDAALGQKLGQICNKLFALP
jgi:hypothetical protein